MFAADLIEGGQLFPDRIMVPGSRALDEGPGAFEANSRTLIEVGTSSVRAGLALANSLFEEG